MVHGQVFRIINRQTLSTPLSATWERIGHWVEHWETSLIPMTKSIPQHTYIYMTAHSHSLAQKLQYYIIYRLVVVSSEKYFSYNHDQNKSAIKHLTI
jgi:hypothetical protein